LTEDEALRHLGGSDEPAARRAFDTLYQRYLPFTESALRRKFAYSNAADVENAAQQAFLKLWQSRRSLTLSDLPSWRGLLSATARNCYIDILRSSRSTLPPEGIDEVPPDERPFVLEIVDRLALATMTRRLSYAADVFWLGISRKRPVEEHRRRLLAARLFYLEGADLDETLDLLNRPRPGVRPLSRSMLAEWLDAPDILLPLAYSVLYYAPAALTAHLLELPEETSAETLDALLTDLTSAESPLPVCDQWTHQEAHAILWRYYRNASPQREPGIPQSTLNLEELYHIFDRCRALFPFSSQMADLLQGTQGELAVQCGPSQPGLWRRLAFQYRYLDELAHQDIEERIAPAAQQVDFLISQTVLQGWLSSRRLLEALAQTCAELLEEYNDE